MRGGERLHSPSFRPRVQSGRRVVGLPMQFIGSVEDRLSEMHSASSVVANLQKMGLCKCGQLRTSE